MCHPEIVSAGDHCGIQIKGDREGCSQVVHTTNHLGVEDGSRANGAAVGVRDGALEDC